MKDTNVLLADDTAAVLAKRQRESFRRRANDRCAYLFAALQYASHKTAMLNVYDRMLINQERGALLHKMDYSQAEERRVPEKVELKLKEIHKMMAVTKWSPIGEDELSPSLALPDGEGIKPK
jgi:hypothetical protein